MKSFSSFSRHILFKSLTALTIYPLLSSFFSDGFSKKLDDHVFHGNPRDLKNPPLASQESYLSENPFVDQRSMRLFFLNYFALLLVMLVLDTILKAIFQHFRKTKDIVGGGPHKSPKAPIEANWKKEIILTAVISTVVCCFYQIMMEGLNPLLCPFITASPSSVCMSQPGILKEAQSHRLLEEAEPINYEYDEQHQDNSSTERISLSLGKVLSSMNLQASHMIVTKDMKYAFATLTSSGGLKVIDISNLAAPNVVKTLSFPIQSIFSKQRFMYLSPDEKTLFVSCFEVLEIFDITNPESANRVAYLEDEKFLGVITKFDKFRLSISFALSADSKTLFVGGFGLQIFDISDLEGPILLDSQLTAPKLRSYLPLAIATTADRKTLWIANGTLDAYNISDARNMRLINSFSDSEISMNSIVLSHDNKTAFGLGMVGTEKIQIAKLDVSNPVSPVKTQSFAQAQTSLRPAFIISLSQKDRYLFITADITESSSSIVVFDWVDKRMLTNNDQSLLAMVRTVTTLPKENYLLASGSSKTMIIKFYKDFPNREIFSLTDYPRWKIEMTEKYNTIDFTQDGNYLCVTSYGESSSKSLFEIYDFQNKTSPDRLASFEIGFITLDTIISADGRRAGISGDQKILFLDISNIAVPSYYSEYEVGKYSDLEDIAFWSDSNIVFLITHTYELNKNAGELRVIDLSDAKSPSILYQLALAGVEDQSYKMAFSQNKTLFFLVGPTLRIYNSSDIHNLHQIGSIDITTEETEFVYFAQVSHDGKKCFVETVDKSSFHKLKIYDTSDLQNPKLTAELILPVQRKKFSSVTPTLSEDSKTLYLLQNQDILAIDVSNIRVPRIFGLLPISDVYREEIGQVKLSGDGRTMYFATKNGTMHSMSLQVPQTFYLNQEEFYIGEQYSDTLLVLKLNEESEYTLMKDNEYKILKVGTFEVKVEATAETAKSSQMLLPSWADFDQPSKMLAFEPRKQTDIGYHTLFAIMSNKVYASAFSFLDPVNITSRSTYLISELILRGYLDRQHFLTSEVGSLEEFFLPNIFNAREKEQIYRILNEYYVVTCTTIKILPSLKVVQEEDKLFISSPNNDYVKIKIQLQNTTHAKFLRRSYGSLSPVISNTKSHLTIEGSLKDVNAALKNLTIDLENLETCSAEMTVADDMNPSVTVNLNDIRNFLRINQAPYINPKKSIQTQINIVPVYTGQYFTITLDRNSILDENTENLNYKLIPKAGKTNDTIPTWLTFDDLTMRGTVPEELFDRDIEFVLVASNEFKKVEVPFKLHLKISSTFVAKLIMKYSPYILTIIGLYIQANKIYNIVGKKYYRHKKYFYVEIGKEITNEIVFPIAFIQEEKRESEIIWEYLKKREVRNLLDGESNMKERISKLIEETVDNYIPKERKKRLKIYLRGVEYRKKIVYQLVFNKLISLQLSSKGERSTKRAFEKMKGKWPELVDWDSSSEYFKANIDKLSEILTETQDVTRDSGSVEERLISKPQIQGVNLSLLSKALEAYTFASHSLDRLAIRSKIKLKEKTERNSIQSFFKFDIESINHNSQLQAVYGISWRFKHDSLIFAGVPCEDFKDKTLVIQILNSQHKILKEIWIHEKSLCDSEERSTKSVEAEEKYYEVL